MKMVGVYWWDWSGLISVKYYLLLDWLKVVILFKRDVLELEIWFLDLGECEMVIMGVNEIFLVMYDVWCLCNF